MRTLLEILEDYYAAYPSPKYEWFFRAGRMAEEIHDLRVQVAELKARKPQIVKIPSPKRILILRKYA